VVQAAEGLRFANPVHAGSMVEFSVAGGRSGKLAIFDVAGRLVNNLSIAATGVAATGKASWDLTDEGGRVVSPGIYFVRFGDTRNAIGAKLIVLK
jgi:hypothetical protein